jgi:hypothetical protein
MTRQQLQEALGLKDDAISQGLHFASLTKRIDRDDHKQTWYSTVFVNFCMNSLFLYIKGR